MEFNISSVDSILAIVATVGVAFGFLWKFFAATVKKEKLHSIKESFHSTVTGLSSDKISEQIASAILLRRFFDKDSEFGLGRTPYAKEAVNVIAGLLRYESTNDFQKILGDGLAAAPNLINVDLQRTNLQNIYLSRKDFDISRADFFSADLSHASLKGVQAVKTTFYRARLCGTVFQNAKLSGANFKQSDVDGAKFEGAELEGADFSNAVNIPNEILKHLNESGIYCKNVSKIGKTYSEILDKIIFCATPGILNYKQKQIYDYVQSTLKAYNCKTNVIHRKMYQSFGITTELKRNIKGAQGVVIFGFSDILINEGVYRENSQEEKKIINQSIMSPWIHTEIGIAIGSSKPLLLIKESESENFGVFEDVVNEINITKLPYENNTNLDKQILDWVKGLQN